MFIGGYECTMTRNMVVDGTKIKKKKNLSAHMAALLYYTADCGGERSSY